MFSNDKNVGTITQLTEVLRHYIGLQPEYMKLDIIEKVVRLLTVTTIMVAFCTILLTSLTYLSSIATFALQTLVGSFIWTFLVADGGYLLLFFFFILLCHSLVGRSLVRFLGSLLVSK